MTSLIEQQYEELSLAKRQLIEYEARENNSLLRWNNLLAENIHKDDRVRGLKLQIERNLDNLQVLMHDHDIRTFDLCKKVFEVVAICGNEQQKDAAFFLTEQLPLVQEERREIVMENEQFHLSNQELINDIERVKSELDRLRVFIDQNFDLESASQQQVLSMFKDKLDKVHERVEQEKLAERVSILSDLRSELEQLEVSTAREIQRKQQLQKKLEE